MVLRPFVRLAAAALAGVVLLAPAGGAVAQTVSETNATLDQLFGAHAPYQRFLAALQKAAAAGDKAAVAALVSYPLEVHAGGKTLHIRDARHFVADWDKAMTPKVLAAIRKQTYPTLFANSNGLMIGDGEVWFSGVGASETVLITAINP